MHILKNILLLAYFAMILPLVLFFLKNHLHTPIRNKHCRMHKLIFMKNILIILWIWECPFFNVQGADCLRIEHGERRAGLGVIQRARVCAPQSPRFRLDYVLYATEDIFCCLRSDCLLPVFWICGILVRIRIRWSVPLINGSGSCYFRQWPSRWQLKSDFYSFFAYYFLKLHLHHFSKIKCNKEVTKK